MCTGNLYCIVIMQETECIVTIVVAREEKRGNVA